MLGQSQGRRLAGGVPGPLPPGRSIYQLGGTVLVNGKAAGIRTTIQAGDNVQTRAASRVIFVVGKDAFILRSHSHLQLKGESAVIAGLRLLTGKLLSVFGRRRHRVSTPLATIGIRGTGLYVEAEPDRAYVCTCYGTTDLSAAQDPASAETIESEHHDEPRYILAEGASGARIRPAPFKNHTDAELALIEALVGRETPFGFRFDQYDSRRRGYTP